MDKTINFDLKKPAADDFYNVQDINSNMDILDTELKTAQEKAEQAFTQASNGKEAIKAAITGVDPTVTIPTDATFAQLADAIGQIETGIDTTDATATAETILKGLTAYVNNLKITGTMVRRNGNGNGYTDMSSKIANAWAGVGRLHFPILSGAYLDTPGDRDTPMGYLDDPDYVAANFRADKNVFGLQGSIPIWNPSYSDQAETSEVSVGEYTGNGERYAYLKVPTNCYNNGVNWVRVWSPYLRPEYILSNANIYGVQGAAVAGKRFASGTVRTSTGVIDTYRIRLSSSQYSLEAWYYIHIPSMGLGFTPRIMFLKPVTAPNVFTLYSRDKLVRYGNINGVGRDIYVGEFGDAGGNYYLAPDDPLNYITSQYSDTEYTYMAWE